MSTRDELPTCYRHPDRETGLSCSECGRPICTECMTSRPSGSAVPTTPGKRAAPRSRRRAVVRRSARRAAPTRSVTKALIAVNVAIYLITAVQGSGLEQPGRHRSPQVGPLTARPSSTATGGGSITADVPAREHRPHRRSTCSRCGGSARRVEQYLGRARFLGLYFVSGLAGSAGALVADAELRHGRRVRRDLRDPRRDADPRVAGAPAGSAARR